jgi:hypothetical protein
VGLPGPCVNNLKGLHLAVDHEELAAEGRRGRREGCLFGTRAAVLNIGNPAGRYLHEAACASWSSAQTLLRRTNPIQAGGDERAPGLLVSKVIKRALG